jgi:hypothetical protein
VTEVLDSEVARHKANVWLLETVGNLLGAENAELIMDGPLRWRYDVILGLPDLDSNGPICRAASPTYVGGLKIGAAAAAMHISAPGLTLGADPSAERGARCVSAYPFGPIYTTSIKIRSGVSNMTW